MSSPPAPPPLPPNLQLRTAWAGFVDSVATQLVPQPDDRPLDQYLPLRDTVLTLVRTEDFLGGLEQSWASIANYPSLSDALVMELKAFPLSVEVAQASEKAATAESKSWWRKLLGRASTTTGSIKDVAADAPPYVKMTLTLFNELIDLFKE